LEDIKDYSYGTIRKVNPRSNAKNLKLIWSPAEAYDNPSMMSLEKNQIRYIYIQIIIINKNRNFITKKF